MQPAQDPAEEKIPRILHYIFLSGFDEFVKQTEVPRARMKKAYYDSCVAVHQHWEIKFWTQQMADDLIRTHYEWFWPVWETYDMEVLTPMPGSPPRQPVKRFDWNPMHQSLQAGHLMPWEPGLSQMPLG